MDDGDLELLANACDAGLPDGDGDPKDIPADHVARKDREAARKEVQRLRAAKGKVINVAMGKHVFKAVSAKPDEGI